MKTIQTSLLIAGFLILFSGFTGQAQSKTWTLEECINYALDKNIQVQKADLTNNQNQLYSDQAQNNRLPSVNASASQNFNWYNGFDSSTGQIGNSKGSNSSNYSVNSNVLLFNGDKLKNKIRQSEINLQSGQFYSEAVKQSVGLNILNAYLQVSYEIRENVYFEVSGLYRHYKTINNPTAATTTMFTGGIRINMFNRRYDL